MTTRMTIGQRYCDATNPLSIEGCFERPNHEGQHWGWGEDTDTFDGQQKVFWDDRPAEFTKEELGVLLMLLAPVKQFFPELAAKIERESVK